jgi:hypothetical protein
VEKTVMALARWTRIAVALGLLILPIWVAVTMLGRIAYPFELEWMEGGSWQHILRLQAGQPLYAAPALDFTPFLYPPLYYWVAAKVMAILPSDTPLLAMRLVSVLALFAIWCILYAWVRAKSPTASKVFALAAVALHASTFKASGFFFDTARVDTLALALMLASVWRWDACQHAIPRHRWRVELQAMLLGCAAIATKQTLLPMVLVAGFLAAGSLPRRLVRSGLFLAALALTYFLIQKKFGDHFFFYAFTLPSSHRYLWPQAWSLLWNDFFLPFFPCHLLGMSALLWWAQNLHRQGGLPAWAQFLKRESIPLGVAATAFVFSWLGRLHTGGYLNVWMPWHALWSLELALLSQAAWTFATHIRTPSRLRWVLAMALLVALACGQVLLSGYRLSWQIPSAADKQAGRELVQRIQAHPHPLWIPGHPYLLGLAHKPMHGHRMAWEDVLRSGLPEAEPLRQALLVPQRDPRISWLLDSPDITEEGSWVASPPKLTEAWLPEQRVFYPVTGERLRPAYLFLRP